MAIEQARAQATAKSDQNWAMMGQLRSEIERIADGDIRPTDIHLIRGVMHAVAGDLHIRLAEAEDLECADPTPGETP